MSVKIFKESVGKIGWSMLFLCLTVFLVSAVKARAASQTFTNNLIKSGGNIVMTGKMGIYTSDFRYLQQELEHLLNEIK